jgi:hypothetical protein
MSYLTQIAPKLQKDYLVVVTTPFGKIQGILDDDSFELSLSDDLTEPMLGGTLENSVKGIGVGVVNLVHKGAGQKLSNNIVTLGSTLKTFHQGQPISFSIRFAVIPGIVGSSYDELQEICAKLTQSKIFGKTLQNYYITPVDSLALGENSRALDGKLCSVHIGKWFSTPAIFWVSSASISMSTIIDTTGNPAFATVSLTFDSYRALDANEINFIKVPSKSNED